MKEKKTNLWKFILIIVIVLLLVFIVITARKMIIISSLRNKKADCINNDNYFMQISSYQGSQVQRLTTYHKNEETLTTLTLFSNDKVTKMIGYKTEELSKSYIDNGNEKIVSQDTLVLETALTPFLYEENFAKVFMQAISTSIKTEECNGKDCYYFSNLDTFSEGVYIDKETGLPVRAFEGTLETENGEITNIVVDYKYEFGIVTDENMKVPNEEEYKIQDNS